MELVSLEGKVILGAVKDILQSQYSSSGDNGLVMTVKTGSEHHETVSMVQMESVVAPIIRASEGITVSLKEEAGASNENIDALVGDCKLNCVTAFDKMRQLPQGAVTWRSRLRCWTS